jgi:FtsH-binding integral membrane protein
LTGVNVLGRQQGAIDAGSSRTGRWLRAKRLRIAAIIGALEGLLVVVHAFGRWPSIFAALIVLVWWGTAGRNLKSYTGRQLSWIAAASQAFVLLVPIFFFFVKAAAIAVVAVVAVVALLVLFTERDRK